MCHKSSIRYRLKCALDWLCDFISLVRISRQVTAIAEDATLRNLNIIRVARRLSSKQKFFASRFTLTSEFLFRFVPSNSLRLLTMKIYSNRKPFERA